MRAGRTRTTPRSLLGAFVAGLALCHCERPHADVVDCTFLYGGDTYHAAVAPSSDPYRSALVPIGDEFAFRGTYVKSPTDVAVLGFYAYYVSDNGPVLLEQTRYYPPYAHPIRGAQSGFTGMRALYAPHGHELQYWCQWR